MVCSNTTKIESDKHGKHLPYMNCGSAVRDRPHLQVTHSLTAPSLRTSRNNTRLLRCHDRCSRRTFLSRERRHVRAAVLVPIQQSTRNTRPAHVLAEPGTYPCQDTSSHCLRNIPTPGVARSCRRLVLNSGLAYSCRRFCAAGRAWRTVPSTAPAPLSSRLESRGAAADSPTRAFPANHAVKVS